MVAKVGKLLVAGLVGGVGAACGAQTPMAEPEVRGTWITTTGNDAISTPAKSAATMKRLREIGLNVVYVECWKNGYTEFPSETMQKLVGVSMKVNGAPKELQRDLLSEGIIEAHRNGMMAIGWFEYGFIASFKDTHNELRALGEKEGWILQTKEGKVLGKQTGFVWMNPLHPKAQQIVLDIVLDAVRKYDLDGVQLDDRIAMPTEMGYDPYTRELYAKEHNGAQPPEDPTDSAWVQWRADKITAYAKRFAAEMRKVNPKLIVSVSPAPHPWSLENYACDWPAWVGWMGEEKWDEYVPQNYRINGAATKKSIEEGFKYMGDRRRDLIAGIRVVGDGPDMPVADLLDSIRFTRETKMGGHVLWFSRGVLDVYPEELKAFYDVADKGQAPHPARPANWRRPAVVATKSGTGTWTFAVPEAGRYRVLSKRGPSWTEAAVRELAAGEAKYEDGEATAVEVVVDRR